MSANPTQADGMKATPGPWAVDGFNLGAVIVETSPKHWDKIAECGCHDNWRANAQAIAALPDLYDALEYMTELFKGLAGDQSTDDGWKNEELLDVYERAQAALRKAEGRV